ncbi:hypothetical protein PINS_up012877 [Pythium insidiosum]|nr:hypothetical protein PINS_up012877 [Pythium insidiosum]
MEGTPLICLLTLWVAVLVTASDAASPASLCASFLRVSDYAHTHCDVQDIASLSRECVEGLELFADALPALLRCETEATSEDEKARMAAYVTLYARWQEHRTCEIFHERERFASVHCSADAIARRPWTQESRPLDCDSIFEFYGLHRSDLDAVCERTAYSDAFWEAFADYTAPPLCKTYYAALRQSTVLDCGAWTDDQHWSFAPNRKACEQSFAWYTQHKDDVEQRCLETRHARTFYRGFYAWAAAQDATTKRSS